MASKVQGVINEYKAGHIVSKNLTKTQLDLSESSKFLEYLKVCGYKVLPKWTACIEALKETTQAMGSDIAKVGFTDSLDTVNARELLTSEKERKSFMEALLETLRCTNPDSRFPQEVMTSADRVLQAMLEGLKTEIAGFASETCAAVGPLMNKLTNLLDPKAADTGTWTSILRLLATCVSTKAAVTNYLDLGPTAKCNALRLHHKPLHHNPLHCHNPLQHYHLDLGLKFNVPLSVVHVLAKGR